MNHISIAVRQIGNQIVRIGLISDTGGPIEELPSLHITIKREMVRATPEELVLKQDLLIDLTAGGYVNEVEAMSGLARWLGLAESVDEPSPKLVFAGWNLASTLRELDGVDDWGAYFGVQEPGIEVSTLYLRPGDSTPPTLDECCDRAGFPSRFRTALGEAYITTKLVRAAMSRERGS